MDINVGEIILAGFFTPAILFFLLGILTTLVKSDMTIPPAMVTAMAIFLLVAIGLEGGTKAVKAIAAYPELLLVIIIVAIISIILGPFFAFSTANILKTVAKLKTADAWAAGGHYGAVSAATLAVGVGIATAAAEAAPGQLVFTGWMPAMYPFMDSPALLTAIILGRMALAKEKGGAGTKVDIKRILHHSIFGMAVWLLICSLLIGMLAQAFSPVEMGKTMVFFDGLFRGVLALFLLDMGIVAGKRLSALKEIGANLWKVILLAFALPQVWGAIGILGIFAVHLAMPGLLGWGDAFVFATIAGGASYISAPAAMRVAIPEANPSIYLPMSLALTFPFNIIVGMILWQIICRLLWGAC
ncbi:sodium-dependent bicarbonate transport family permease [Thermodesulfovibrionales bacterium]|nr:sodium-dependent bicarbonate transport family permease [Thermodesulfovibrionales bacterium]MCL0068965.1 sodium-dependent bicarbonate transport family permease [Thermodesulfovibrionales bacterium]MCL0072217.1 sodium-dependent bicarbonate transport family permease [Thermodesulfovibrionales bacterium]MCL0096781.1 sodium-dependent bicarbonate transport family permease [Thermodesulfovibrionales bacterium]